MVEVRQPGRPVSLTPFHGLVQWTEYPDVAVANHGLEELDDVGVVDGIP